LTATRLKATLVPSGRRFSVPKGPSIKVVRDVVRLGARGAASSIDAWMRDNFEALQKELRPYRANWETLADRLGQAGLTNTAGGKLTAATARKTWQRIRADMGTEPVRERQGRRHGTPASARRTGADETPSTEPNDASDPPPRHTFGPAKIR
jgi:hypothetical protein